MSISRPGQLTRFGSLLAVEEEARSAPAQAGPLLFAGEMAVGRLAGYMNGALQTGRIAAEAALAPAAAMAWPRSFRVPRGARSGALSTARLTKIYLPFTNACDAPAVLKPGRAANVE